MPTPMSARSPASRRRAQGAAVLSEAEATAADPHGAALPAFEMVDAAQQRALARSAGPEQRHHLADPDGEVETVEHGLIAVGLSSTLYVKRRSRALLPFA